MNRHVKSGVAAILSVLLLAGGLSACDGTAEFTDVASDVTGVDVGRLLDDLSSRLDAYSLDAASDPAVVDADADTLVWNMDDAPDYYVVTGPADFTGMEFPPAGGVDYADPDMLGRSGRAVATVTKAMRDAGSDRDRDMPDGIAGWPEENPKVEIDFGDGDAYHGYLFNRSHLIAKSLGGADDPENMITGTRTQNVGRNQPAGGMAYAETLARDWLDGHPDGTVRYAATPVYVDDELLPRVVIVDVRTSDGSIDQHVIVYNAANGYDIDYAHGGVL